MRPALVIPLVLISVTAACTAGPPPAGEQAATMATWTDELSGGSAVGALSIDPATGMLIELQTPPTDPAQPDTSAVLALDPVTGRQIWSTLTGDQEPSTAIPDNGLLAIATTSASNVPTVWVLDARSGAEERSINVPAGDQVLGLSGGSIITSDTSNSIVSGFSPASGRQIWDRRGFGGCSVGEVAVGGGVVGVLANCPGNEITLVGIDPATGRELWSRPVNRNFGESYFGQPVSASEPVTLAANDNLFGVSSAGTISLYTDAGRLLDTEPAQLSSPAWFTIAGSQALLVYQSPAGDLTVKTIDIATHAARTLLREPYVMGPAAFSNGVAYINAAGPEPLLPTLLIALNVATGSYGVFALPFAGPVSYYSLLTTSDEVMLISSLPARSFIAAYRFSLPGTSTPHRIAGGAPGQWPAACSLVPASAIARLADGPYVAVPRTVPAGMGWPDASTCDFVPGRAGLPLVTVSVAWRAPGTAQAKELLRNATAGWSRLDGVEDPAFRDPVNSGDVLMRIRSTIVEVKVSGTPRVLSTLADSVARQVEAGL